MAALKQLNIEQALLSRLNTKTTSNIVLDTDTWEFTSDENVISYLSTYGVDLVNQGYGKKVLDILDKQTGGVNKSDKVRYIKGLANFHIGNYYGALEFLKSINSKSELATHEINYAEFLFLHIRRTLKIISEDVFEKAIVRFNQSPIIKAYKELIYRKKAFQKNPNREYEAYLEKLSQISEEYKSFPSIYLQAEIDKLSASGWAYLDNLRGHLKLMVSFEESKIPETLITQQRRLAFLKESFDLWMEESSEIRQKVQANSNLIISSLYYQAYCNFLLRVIITVSLLPGQKQIFLEEEEKDQYELLRNIIEDAIVISKHYNQNYNLCICLAVKFEIMDYFGEAEEAEKAIKELMDIAKEFHFEDLIEKTGHLSESGTYYNSLISLKDQLRGSAKVFKQRTESAFKQFNVVHQLEENYIQERSGKFSIYQCMLIDIFDTGIYIIKEDRLKEFYKIFGIDPDSEVSNRLELLAKKYKAIPKINPYSDKIKNEGYGQGYLERNSIEDIERWASRKKVVS